MYGLSGAVSCVLTGETTCSKFLILFKKQDILFYSQVSQMKVGKFEKKQKMQKNGGKGRKREIAAVAKLMHRCE